MHFVSFVGKLKKATPIPFNAALSKLTWQKTLIAAKWMLCGSTELLLIKKRETHGIKI